VKRADGSNEFLGRGEVIYRKGQFFVMEETLADGSKVYDVCANSVGGSEVIILTHSPSGTMALKQCDALCAGLEQ
jgi:hypothetical protein